MNINPSLVKILGVRSEAYSTIKFYSGMVISLTSAVESLDKMLLQGPTGRGSDQQSKILAAAQRLQGLLDTEVPR